MKKKRLQKLDTFLEVKKYLSENLSQFGASDKTCLDMNNYIVEMQHLTDLITRTFDLGESNSAIIVGGRGVGKSALVESALSKLAELETLNKGLIVRLNGLLQTDDRLALQEITRQLQLENFAKNRSFGSFAENLIFLLDSLRSGSKETSKPVLFLLDEFDLFCVHHNQNLLYNLFDTAQSAQAPICVLGLTCRLDVIELLEKRVKSRFSHRQIHLFPFTCFNPDYVQVFVGLLTLPESLFYEKVRAEWNSTINDLSKDKIVVGVLQRLFMMTRDVRSLKKLLFLCICQLTPELPYLNTDIFIKVQKMLSAEGKRNTLEGLSVLQLCLIVAMQHLTTIYDGDPFNFEMVYNEYCKFSRRGSMLQTFERSVVMKAYDQLQSLELIRAVDSTRSVQREYQLVTLMMTPRQVSDTLAQLHGVPTDLQQWASSAIC